MCRSDSFNNEKLNIMKKYIYLLFFAVMMCSCQDWLSISPKNKITGETLFKTDDGIKAYMAGHYDALPMEDFRYDFTDRGYNQSSVEGGKTSMMALPWCVHSEGWNDHAGETGRFGNWEALYKYIRFFNEIPEVIDQMTPKDPATLDQVRGEYYFFMAYSYLALARRYGGVSIIDEYQEFSTDYESLKVPRSTEVDTWKFILRMCDEAATYLPDNTDQRRANKWTALALKSRAALHAASVGKFWDKDGAALTGEAVNLKLVGGFTEEDVKFFYQECINAAAAVIKSGKFSLSGMSLAEPDAIAENYRKLFVEPLGVSEVMFLRDYVYPGKGHSMGKWHEPNQLSTEFAGRMNPTLDYVEQFAYRNPETGAAEYDVKFKTVLEDENYSVPQGYGVWHWKTPVLYAHPLDIFKNRDPRLFASVILPNSQWGGEEILIQNGVIANDTWISSFGENKSTVYNGKTYWSRGAEAESDYSGWGTTRANGSRTGFILKKYLPGPDKDQEKNGQVVTPFVDIRYAEVLMNYAEAVAESGLSDAEGVITAAEALNEVHHRAGFTDNLVLTTENVQRERTAEFGLEYGQIWDLWRRRELHTFFTGEDHKRQALVLMVDTMHATADKPDNIYMYMRAEAETQGKKFETKAYYRPIPGISANGLVQNPNY